MPKAPPFKGDLILEYDDPFWNEEFRIYKNFGTSSKGVPNIGRSKRFYNERSHKHWKCGCGFHSARVTETFNKGVQINNRIGTYYGIPKYVLWRVKNYKLFLRRRLRKEHIRNKKNILSEELLFTSS